MEIGGLLYNPIPIHELECAPHYEELVKLNKEYDVVIVFGGGGDVWDGIYKELHRDVGKGCLGKENFALILRDVYEEKVISRTWRLFKPDDLKGKPLQDPGKMMYWYAACTLLVGRGGLAAQQILATMLSDAPSAPGMLFIEEPGHPQIEHERRRLHELGLVSTCTLDEFESNPFKKIKDTLNEKESFSVIRDQARLRYAQGRIDKLADLILTKYQPHKRGLSAEKVDVEQAYDYSCAFLEVAEDRLELPGTLEGEYPPLQLEIHPPPDDPNRPCLLKCPHCYKQGLDSGAGYEAPDRRAYVKVIEDFKGEVPRIVISGLYSDPLCSRVTSKLLTTARQRIPQYIGLHTKLLASSEQRLNGILDALFEGCRGGDYLTVSLDAGTPETYGKVTGDTRNGEQNFNTVVENLRRVEEMRPKGSLIRLNITYLLLGGRNTRTEDIEGVIKIAEEVNADCIRFSVPQPTVLGDSSACQQSVDLENAIKLIRDLSDEPRTTKILLKEYSLWSADGFKRCYTQIFNPALGADGYFYPCCQVAAGKFHLLRIYRAVSDLNRDNWKIWKEEEKRKELMKMPVGQRLGKDDGCMNCRVCNRKDGAINALISGMVMSSE